MSLLAFRNRSGCDRPETPAACSTCTASAYAVKLPGARGAWRLCKHVELNVPVTLGTSCRAERTMFGTAQPTLSTPAAWQNLQWAGFGTLCTPRSRQGRIRVQHMQDGCLHYIHHTRGSLCLLCCYKPDMRQSLHTQTNAQR